MCAGAEPSARAASAIPLIAGKAIERTIQPTMATPGCHFWTLPPFCHPTWLHTHVCGAGAEPAAGAPAAIPLIAAKAIERMIQVVMAALDRSPLEFAAYLPFFLELYCTNALVGMDAVAVHRIRAKRRVLLTRFLARALLCPYYRPEWTNQDLSGEGVSSCRDFLCHPSIFVVTINIKRRALLCPYSRSEWTNQDLVLWDLRSHLFPFKAFLTTHGTSLAMS